MKKLMLIVWAGMMLALCISCYDDKGSYDYHPINEIKVSNWKAGGYSAIYKSDTLRINPVSHAGASGKEPVILFTEDSISVDRYEYEWTAVTNTVDESRQIRKVVGNQRNLEYFVELPPDPYVLYLKIKDRQTGVIWQSQTYLNVLSVTDSGLLILGEEEDGTVGLDMISMAKDTVVLKSLLNGNGLPGLKNPRRVMFTGSSYRPDYMRLWIATGDGSYYLDLSTFQSEEQNSLRGMVYSSYNMPKVLNLVDMSSRTRYTSMGSSRVMMSDDYVFATSVIMEENYTDPLNRLSASDENFFRPFPFIFTSVYYPACWIVYDEDHHCFTYFMNSSALAVTKLQDASDEVFPWIQPEGRKCIYGENTMNTSGGSTNGNSMTLMEDKDSFYVYQFYAYASVYSPTNKAPQKRAGYVVDKTKAIGLKSNLLYAFASQRSLLLYAEGSILHAYDYANNIHYQKDLGDEITFLKFDFYGDNYDEFIVATYDPVKKGIVKRYLLNSDLNTFEPQWIKGWEWDGLVKVKDIDFR